MLNLVWATLHKYWTSDTSSWAKEIDFAGSDVPLNNNLNGY